ncbi:MAG: hypothetical protein J0H65_14540 [Rhizobiales bacterium]|nr:hypothetical protein [Hyphomicrobiales bacterium]
MWVLFYHGKRIGFFVFHERLDGERWREDKSDYRVVNWILTAGESWPGVPSYKFQTFEEQDEIMQIIKFALACYYGVGEAPRHGVEARFHDILKSRIAKGFNIAKQL